MQEDLAEIDLFSKRCDSFCNEVAIYHDERYANHWLYHGFIFIDTKLIDKLRTLLISYRQSVDCDRRVHFSRLNSRSFTSRRTALAKMWCQSLQGDLQSIIRFYCLGISLDNLALNAFGMGEGSKSEVKTRIYNRFFEIGLYSAIRWFYTHDKVYIRNIYSEYRDISPTNPFETRAPYRIGQRNQEIIMQSPCVKMIITDICNPIEGYCAHEVLQMVDVYIGAISQVLDYSSESKQGCIELAECWLPFVRQIISEPYNSNASYYKRFAITFFPKRRSTVSDINNPSLLDGLFFNSRALLIDNRDQVSLFSD